MHACMVRMVIKRIQDPSAIAILLILFFDFMHSCCLIFLFSFLFLSSCIPILILDYYINYSIFIRFSSYCYCYSPPIPTTCRAITGKCAVRTHCSAHLACVGGDCSRYDSIHQAYAHPVYTCMHAREQQARYIHA